MPPENAPDGDDLARRVLIGAAVLGGVAVAVLLAWQAATVLLVAFTGVLLGILLDGIGGLVSRVLPVRGRTATRGLIVLLLVGVGIGLVLFGSQLEGWIATAAQELPRALESAEQSLRASRWGQQVLDRLPPPDEMLGNFTSGAVPSAFGTVFGVVAHVLVTLFVAIYVAADPSDYTENALLLVHPKHRDRAREVAHDVHHALQSWLLGQLSSMFIIGTLVAVALSILGVPYAVLIGLLTFLLEFVPYVGPALASVPAVLLAMSGDGVDPLYVLGVYLGVQFLESYLVTPLIQRKAVQLPPAALITVQAVMGVLAGALGVLVAAPLLVLLVVLVQALYLKGELHEDVQIVGTSA